MWRDYSSGYIKNNRASSVSIIAAAFISAMLLSFLCSLFFNFWTYEIEQIILEEGGWQARIVGEISGEDLTVIQSFANVERAEINEELSKEQGTTVDIYFQNVRTIFKDMPLIIERLGLEEDAASYHLLLLSRYLVHDPQDEEPPLLMTFYLAVLLMVSLSLVLIIHNAFAVSMNARLHQFGIFSSIGAMPGQIRTCLMQEAAALCAAPVLLGSFLGIALSAGAVWAMNILAADAAGRHAAVFQYHPAIFGATLLLSGLTVLLSAWIPARKLSRLTPLQAIRGTGELRLKRKKNSRILSALFGVEGELAGNALRAQKKALRTSTLSLTLSFLGFTLMLCFFTLSDISTRYTYFDRYQAVWDVMVTVKDTKITEFDCVEQLRELEGIQDCTVYQKAEALTVLSEKAQSGELAALGGLDAVAGTSVSGADGFWLVKTPIVILDDAAFTAYCEQTGIVPGLDGAVILNRIWDSLNSNFRYKSYVPFVDETQEKILLQNKGNEGTTEVSVIGYTQEAPALREEYENYALVQFIPLSLWESISAQIGNAEADTYIRILAKEGATLEELNALEAEVSEIIGREYAVESENRVQEKISNDDLIWGYKVIMGAFCAVLALIGIANVFSNTLGFLRQRRRELAQLSSVGMTPSGMRKMFFIEALVIAGRPLLITLPLTAAAVGFMIRASYLNPMEFIEVAPVTPCLVFILAIFGFVGLAYDIGAKRCLGCDLSSALRNDAMV